MIIGKQALIRSIAEKLRGWGYDVYLSRDGRHGFYTDGSRVVSFGGSWETMVDFSGNYRPTSQSGTGWGIANEMIDITQDQARAYVTANAPSWANAKPVYTTPAQHLATYGKSSGFYKF